jgi:hypothetical protein
VEAKTPGTETTGAATYDKQLAALVAELLPDLSTDGRLELLRVMDETDLRTSLEWLAGHAPQMFDFALVRDRALAGRLQERADEDPDDDGLEPYCSACGSAVGIFRGHGEEWHHYRGKGTTESRVELYDAGHEPAVSWRPAGER